MFLKLTGAALAGGVLLAAAPALAQNSCTRADLQAAVDSYLTAQTAGDPSLLNRAPGMRYDENWVEADYDSGFLNQPQTIDFDLTILDEDICQTFSEIVITDPAHPYVLGVHLTVDRNGQVAELSTIITDDDDWLFSAERFLDGVRDEDWGPIPESRWDSRETLIAAANAYFDMFNDPSIQPDWAEQCHRQEGGMRTQGSCSLSQPLNVDFPEPRRFVVDRARGAVAGLVWFSGRLPDSHLFRLNDGGVRYIHTITWCDTFNCSFDLSETLRAEREARDGQVE